MDSLNLKWVDIISSVEKAHLEATNNLKMRERLINRKYVEQADEQMQRKKQEAYIKKTQQLQERLRIEQEILQEENAKKLTKQLKRKKEKEYSKDNFDMMLGFKPSYKRCSTYSEHPFTIMVDQSDRRRQIFKQRLRRQNEINTLQEKVKRRIIQIKKRQLTQRKIEEKQQRQKYINHVEAFYLKKIEDRNVFKNKYLKLTNSQKSQLLLPLNQKTIQKEYQTINAQLMKTNKLKKLEVDHVLGSINKYANIPDSSPAYLGRIPISTDRKRQLDYLERSAYQSSPGDRKRLKTEGDLCDSKVQIKRYPNQIQQLPVLERYFNNLSTLNQKNESLQQQSKVQLIRSPIIGFKKIQQPDLIRNTTNQKNIDKIKASNYVSQRSQNSTAKKVFSTYDIIGNQKRFICM